MTRPRAAAVVLAAIAALAAPVPAWSADVAVDTPCVRAMPGAATATVTATGFTPGATVTVRADDRVLASGVAAPSGTLTQAIAAPPPTDPVQTRQTFALTATDDRGAASPPRPLLVTRVGVSLPERARPTSVVRYRAYGFETGRAIWLHVRRDGRTLGRFRVGRASGPCGDATARLRSMPLRRFRPGTYAYWFSHERRYSVATRVYGLRVEILPGRGSAPRPALAGDAPQLAGALARLDGDDLRRAGLEPPAQAL